EAGEEKTYKKEKTHNKYEEKTHNKYEEKTHKAKVHLLRFHDPKNCALYDQVVLKNKMVECRKNTRYHQTIKPNDIVLLSNKSKGILECLVTYVKYYADLAEYITTDGIEKIFGDTRNCGNIKTVDEALKIYHQFIDDEHVR